MNNNEINYLGPYRFRENIRHRKQYWASRVGIIGMVAQDVIDAAGATADGRNVVRLIPYGPNNHELDGVLHDGDLLGYLQGPLNKSASLNSEVIGEIVKGRVSHAEIGYAGQGGEARQVSLWMQHGAILPYDRPFHEHKHSDGTDAISIYRVSLAGYGVDAAREAALKSEVKRWKRIVQPVYFPVYTMNTDPMDFTTVEELGHIARGFVSHSPKDGRPPFEFKLNCVQWSTLVFSLATCYPLSRSVLARCGLLSDYERNWANELGFAQEGLEGIDELPIPFYTVAEAIENTLDLYLPELKTRIQGLIDPTAVASCLRGSGITLDQRFVMPAAFMIENRLRASGIPRKTKSVFEYVATAVPENELFEIV